MTIKDFCEGEYVLRIYTFTKRMGLSFAKETLKKIFFYVTQYFNSTCTYLKNVYFEMENFPVPYHYQQNLMQHIDLFLHAPSFCQHAGYF